jgi:peroxiredoxin
MRKKGIIFILIVIGLFTGCSMEKGKGVGDIAPDFTLKSVDGHDVSLSEYRGKVVLIDFWATWCPPCEDSVPSFNNIYKKYKDNGFIILGLSLDNKPSVVKTFKGRYKIDYPLLMAGKAT